jgi:hypothetical protein
VAALLVLSRLWYTVLYGPGHTRQRVIAHPRWLVRMPSHVLASDLVFTHYFCLTTRRTAGPNVVIHGIHTQLLRWRREHPGQPFPPKLHLQLDNTSKVRRSMGVRQWHLCCPRAVLAAGAQCAYMLHVVLQASHRMLPNLPTCIPSTVHSGASSMHARGRSTVLLQHGTLMLTT